MHHRTAQRAHKSELQRSNPNGWLTWQAHRTVSGGAPDCPVRHATAHSRTVHRTCPVHHRTAQRPHLSELQWLEPNDRLTWLAHRTVCGAPCDSSLPTTIFGGWGYKYPNHPTFNGIQVFHLQHITRAIALNSRHNQRDQILSQVRNHSKSNSD